MCLSATQIMWVLSKGDQTSNGLDNMMDNQALNGLGEKIVVY